MKFTLTIELGNDAMETLQDVSEAFEQSREGLMDDGEPLGTGDSCHVVDTNGNTVGKWEVTE